MLAAVVYFGSVEMLVLIVSSGYLIRHISYDSVLEKV